MNVQPATQEDYEKLKLVLDYSNLGRDSAYLYVNGKDIEGYKKAKKQEIGILILIFAVWVMCSIIGINVLTFLLCPEC